MAAFDDADQYPQQSRPEQDTKGEDTAHHSYVQGLEAVQWLGVTIATVIFSSSVDVADVYHQSTKS